jgi:hypothetical protein
MPGYASRAEEGFGGAEGRFGGAFNAAMSAKSLDQAAVTNLVAGLQRQAQGLVQLARAVAELEETLNAIKRKLGIP